MNHSANAFRSLRLIGLGIALVLSLLALLPPAPAEAASCGGWGYFGCCFGAQVKMKQQRTCCDDFGYCWNETRCTGSACPV